jgi:tRNA dimethylallyltransferase
MHPLIAIVGPTASGKSELALYLAERFGGEIVNYDSVQIFKHLDIGTAKPTPEERARVPHHLIDIREPSETFTAGDYQREGRDVLRDITLRGRLPILVGGTGLYLRALTEGLFSGPQRSEALRQRLEIIANRKGREHLHRILQRLDPAAGARIMPRDKPKVIRALEVRLETGTALTEHLNQKPRDPISGYTIHLIGLNPPREELYARIDERVVRMFKAGLVHEVRQLLEQGLPRSAKVLDAIGYRHVLSYLDSGHRRDDTIRMIQRDTRRYAKRQLTWFRRLTDVRWFGGPGDRDDIQSLVHHFVVQRLEQYS